MLTEISVRRGNIFSYECIFLVERDHLVSTKQAQQNIKEFKMAHDQATRATLISNKSRNNFRWEEKHVKDLINCIISYKTKMTYCVLDFDRDKPRMYKEPTESMAEIC